MDVDIAVVKEKRAGERTANSIPDSSTGSKLQFQKQTFAVEKYHYYMAFERDDGNTVQTTS